MSSIILILYITSQFIAAGGCSRDQCRTSNNTPASHIRIEPRCMHTSQQDFAKIRYLPAFVDKSLLIKEIIDGEPRILLTAPRRFGKSINLNMLKRFFERNNNPNVTKANRQLFKDLLIDNNYSSIVDKHFGKYPVIFMDFKALGTIETYDDAFAAVRSIVHETYRMHSYLQHSDKIQDFNSKKYIAKWCDENTFKTIATKQDEIFTAVIELAEYLCAHFDVTEVLLLIDEYDSICANAVFHVEDVVNIETGKIVAAEKTIKKIINLCAGVISCLAKGNENVGRVILTGISYLMTQGLGAVNNIGVYKFQEMHRYSQFYGLTGNEVKQLLHRFSLDHKFDEVHRYYNGYRNNIYSVLSIMGYLNSASYLVDLKPKNYWKNSGIVANNLDETLYIPEVRSMVFKLMADLTNKIKIEYFQELEYTHISQLIAKLRNENLGSMDVDVFFNLLLEQGYLRIEGMNYAGNEVVIRIPNEEIKSEFHEKFRTFFVRKYKMKRQLINECASVFDEINSSDENNKKRLNEIFHLLNEIIKPLSISAKNEATFHHIVYVIVSSSSKFKCFSEIKVSEGREKRLDLFLLSCEMKLGIIIELKYDQSADEALKQIIDKKYYVAFNNRNYNPDNVHIEYKLFIGLDVSSEQEVTMSVLLNTFNSSEKISFVHN